MTGPAGEPPRLCLRVRRLFASHASAPRTARFSGSPFGVILCWMLAREETIDLQNPPSIDYQKVGLMVGLEVHQQLLTDNKMFCRCPAGRYTDTHDGEVLRHMRPTLSELGEYDGTALMEFRTKKNIIYLLNKENVCTYEMDDTPPFLINQQAIDIAIEQCLMLGCDIVDELHIHVLIRNHDCHARTSGRAADLLANALVPTGTVIFSCLRFHATSLLVPFPKILKTSH